MGFYGKIYEQMGDVFNRAKFINAEENTSTFNTETLSEGFCIDAESHGDKLPIIAGNSWIQFVEGEDDKHSPACIIYHGSAQQDGENIATFSVVPGIDYATLIDGDLLTPEEVAQLKQDRENGLLYFGDNITIGAYHDKAGHMISNKTMSFKLGSIPRLLEILTAEGRITNIEDTIGIDDYPDEKGTVAYRILTLEDDFENVRTIADDAATLATNADASATAAQESAEKAAKAAERAATAAENAEANLTTYQEETEDRLDVVDAKYTSLIGATGVSDAVPVVNQLGKTSLFQWALYADSELDVLNGIIGDEDDAIRNGAADTLVQQIHSNDEDIAQLQKDLTQEIADRIADVNAEEQARITAINNLKSYTDAELASAASATATNLANAVTALNATDTALTNSLTTEKNERTAADIALGGRIDTEAGAREVADQAIHTRIDGVEASITGEGGINTRLAAVESKAAANSEKLVGDETVAGSVSSKIKTTIDAEANLRSAKDNELANAIADLADVIAGLQSLVEAQQTTITELQEKVVELENIINPPTDPNPDPGTGDEGGEEEPPTTE